MGNEDRARALEIKRFVEAYTPLAKEMAMKASARLPSSVCGDDLIQSAMIGVFFAARDFRPEGGACEESFVRLCIRNQIMEFLRTQDWLTRTDRARTREARAAIRQVEQKKGRQARASEVARHMELPLEKFHALLAGLSRAELIFLGDLETEETGAAVLDRALGHERDALELVEQKNSLETLRTLVRRLSERDRELLKLHYIEEASGLEIAKRLKISPGRVCQLHAQALDRLRQWMQVAEAPFASRNSYRMRSAAAAR